VAWGVRAELAGVAVGDGLPVAVMGVINVSPESFHPGSVYRGEEAIVRAALAMVDAGAALVDVGARSTAPYLDADLDEDLESERLTRAVELLAAKLAVPVSADTCRPGPARAALDAGARVINDVSTLRDPALAGLVAERAAGLILMATPPGEGGGVPGARRPRGRRRGARRGHHTFRRARLGRSETGRRTPGTPPRSPSPVAILEDLLASGLRRAVRARIRHDRIVLDPGIGFFRNAGIPWHEWDVEVLARLRALRVLERPLCVGVSRKSFIGEIVGRAPTSERLAGSLAAAAIAVMQGAALIRTHDVAETLDAVRVAERVRR
jgi:dihydropteroate synthase